MLLIETHNREILPTNDDTLYVSVLPTSEICKSVRQYMESVNINEFLNTSQFALYPEDEYHTTIVYSRTGGSALYDLTLELVDSNALASVTAVPTTFTVFGNCLVLLLKSDGLQEIFKKYIAAGATYDFPDYAPHITVGKFAEGTDRNKLVGESIANLNNTIQTLVVSYDKFTAEPLDPEKS